MNANAQVDTIIRNQIQLGYDQSLSGKVPQAAYAYNYLNIPQLRRAIYGAMNGDRSRVRDRSLAFVACVRRNTDFGIGIAGDASLVTTV